MIILHAGYDGGTFWLWGEAPADVPDAVARTAGGPPPAYPFAAPAMHLAVALMEALPGRPLPGGGAPPLLWVPSVRGRPVPSSGLVADVAVVGKVEVLPYTLVALPLPVPLVLDFLCQCTGKETLAPGLLLGPTLQYWVRVLRFAGAVVAREQFIPSLAPTGNSFRSVWRPIVVGEDGRRFARLVKMMPPACRALSTSPASPPDTPAAEILDAFLAPLTDAIVRTSLLGPLPTSSAKTGRVAVSRHETIHDQWLFALNQTTDGLINADPAEISALAEQVEAWQRPIAVGANTPFGLAFRVEEPPADAPADQAWKVRYLLQARDDPSLQIPVKEAWKPSPKVAAQFSARSFQPKEYLLTALGQAASLAQPIEGSLKSPAPAEFRLGPDKAHGFLSQTAFLLEQAGFAVVLPAWWTRRGSKHRIGVKAEIRESAAPLKDASGMLSLNSLVKFDWAVALGDTRLSLEELQELANLKSSLVKVRGQWVQVTPEEIRAAISLLQKRASSQATVKEIVQMALGGGTGPGGLPFAGVEATGDVKALLAQLEGTESFAELAPPQGLNGTLRPYQVRGYSWLAFLRRWGLGACLADDMGLGKTIQTLALLQREWDLLPRPSLLICPTSVVANWKKEAEKFVPDLPVMIHHGQRRLKGSAFVKLAEKHALVLTSYSLLHRDVTLFESLPWGTVILDEAQNIKNAGTKQAQAARMLKADARIALTGTPVENHVGDLWSILEFLNPGWLGTTGEFRKRFFVPIQAQRDEEAAETLKRLTAPFILRRVKTDTSIISDLPDKLEMKEFCTLTKEQATLYQAVVKELEEGVKTAEGIQRKGLILGALVKLKQVCNHPAQFLGDGSAVEGRSGKLARLVELLEELRESGEKVLIFTQFREMGDILKAYLQDSLAREVLFLHGGTPREMRERMVDRFQSADGPGVFLLSLKAGGTGLNLTAANHVFHFDRWWNPAVENQATDRAFRIGQTRKVQVHKFVCVGTVEEKIDEMIERKSAVATQVIGTKEDWLTELDNAQLKDLFTLRQEAIGE